MRERFALGLMEWKFSSILYQLRIVQHLSNLSTKKWKWWNMTGLFHQWIQHMHITKRKAWLTSYFYHHLPVCNNLMQNLCNWPLLTLAIQPLRFTFRSQQILLLNLHSSLTWLWALHWAGHCILSAGWI